MSLLLLSHRKNQFDSYVSRGRRINCGSFPSFHSSPKIVSQVFRDQKTVFLLPGNKRNGDFNNKSSRCLQIGQNFVI